MRQRQIGLDHQDALENAARVFSDWLVPFLSAWVQSGAQPFPSDIEIAALEHKIKEWQREKTLPEGYGWLPGIMSELAGSLRFNRRNFVNIHPAPFVPSVLANALVALQNPNNIVEDVSAATTAIEKRCVSWMAENLVGFDPKRAWGNVVSCGTLANLTALLVARDYCYRKLARPRPAAVRSNGLFGHLPGVVLATAGSHYSIRKAMWCLGLGDENVVTIPVAYDEVVRTRASKDRNFVDGITDNYWSQLIMDSIADDKRRGEAELENFYAGKSQPFALQPLNSEVFKALYGCFQYGTPLIAFVFTVGTTHTGTIERPDQEAVRKLVAEDVFIHADAAAGGFALVHPRVRELVRGLDKAHSVTIDAHKLGHLAYPNGAVIFRDDTWKHEIMHEAPYLEHLAPTIEGSRPGTHVSSLWAAIEDLGKTGRYVSWLDRLFAFTAGLVKEFDASREFQVVHKVDLTTVAVAPIPRPGERRSAVNEVVQRMYTLIKSDRSSEAFLVGVDRDVAGISVSELSAYRAEPDNLPLAPIHCLRIVATNPGVEPTDAPALVAYLVRKLFEARSTV